MVKFICAMMVAIAIPSAAFATTCTARQKTCSDICAKNWNRPGSNCLSYCAAALPQCLQTGCWNTPESNKCGYTKS